MDIRPFIRDVPDFPKAGITFKDITPLLADHLAMDYTVNTMAHAANNLGITKVVGIESRGFLFAPAIAARLHCGFVPVRKPGKLPWKCKRREYALEYGTDAIEIHEDAIKSDDVVLIVDDVLATGGTMAAAISLIEEFGPTIAAASFVINLTFLGGTEKMSCPVHSVLDY